MGFADWWSNFTEPIDHEASADFANDAYAQAVAADMSNGNYDFDVGEAISFSVPPMPLTTNLPMLRDGLMMNGRG